MRPINRVATLVLSLALLAGGVLLAGEALLVALHRPAFAIDRQGWYAGLARTRLDNVLVRTVAIGLVVVGLLIVLAELVRWRPDRVGARLGPEWHLKRRSVERGLTAAVTEVPGVRRGSVRLLRRGTRWRPRINVTGESDISLAVDRAARRELDRLGARTDEAHIDVRRSR